MLSLSNGLHMNRGAFADKVYRSYLAMVDKEQVLRLSCTILRNTDGCLSPITCGVDVQHAPKRLAVRGSICLCEHGHLYVHAVELLRRRSVLAREEIRLPLLLLSGVRQSSVIVASKQSKLSNVRQGCQRCPAKETQPFLDPPRLRNSGNQGQGICAALCIVVLSKRGCGTVFNHALPRNSYDLPPRWRLA